MVALRALSAAFALGCLLLPVRADYLINTDLKDSLGGWHGDGERVFLLPDGTEGSETDKDAIPVIKLKLGSKPEGVYQNYEVRDVNAPLHVTVDIFPSLDFKRGIFTEDQTAVSGSHYVGGTYVPEADFWMRDMPSRFMKKANATAGKWTTITATTYHAGRATDRTIFFVVPPGEGSIYLRNPHITD